MRSVSFSSNASLRRNPAVILCFLALFVYAAYRTAAYIVAGDLTGLSYVALGFVGCAFIVAMLNNWRNGLYFFLSWLLFEDFARKYLGNNMAIFFAKDALVAVVYLSFFAAYRRKEFSSLRPPFLVPVLVFFWFGVMQVFNPASPHLAYGILGLKLFFYYVPLFFIGYSFLESEAGLRRFFTYISVMALTIVSLGIAQSILGHTFLNPARPSDELRDLSTLYRMAPISGVVMYRPTSVFVSDGRYGDFLLVAWMVIFGFSGYLLLRHKRGRILAFVSLCIAVGGIALSASRGVLMWSAGSAIIGIAAFFWGAPWRQREIIRVLRTFQRAALAVGLALVLLLVTFPDALLARFAFYSETLSPTSTASELQLRTWTYPVSNFLASFSYERWPYGYGIGTTSLGTQYVTKLFGVRPTVSGVESGFGALVVEMGFGGLILWLFMSFAIIFSSWQVVKKLKGTPWFPIAFMIFLYATILLIPRTFVGIQAYEDYILNAFLWLLLGILFRLPTLVPSAQFAAVETVPPTNTLRMP